ncbi:MAG: hypothetical protein KatS3mg131_4009 [Candidatus Tectimicrobiota bacterium]|nr:MAG: hypothetical protein KatS3mg131_4009 [Candidatus Tectomicrobia bacterium]
MAHVRYRAFPGDPEAAPAPAPRPAQAEALRLLTDIGVALSAERDLDRLLARILTTARYLVAADAGSLYVLEHDAQGRPYLRFALAQNDSIKAAWESFTLPLSPSSLAGAVALRREVVAIDDVYALLPQSPYRHDRSFDCRTGYRTRSLVGIPLVTHAGETLGVLQLINRKPVPGVPLTDPTTASEVIPFSDADLELLCALASQAAVSLENSRLYKDIERLFDSFVQASVKAIERRDPTTYGHSFRVADGALALARRVERLSRGRWAGTRFSEAALRQLRYAALLHDFGKVGVREQVLTKPRRLYDSQLEVLHYRFRLARAAHRARQLEAWLAEAPGRRRGLPPALAGLAAAARSRNAPLRCPLGGGAARQPRGLGGNPRGGSPC